MTAKSRIVIDAERDDSSDQLTLMDVCRRDAWRGCLDSFAKANKCKRPPQPLLKVKPTQVKRAASNFVEAG